MTCCRPGPAAGALPASVGGLAAIAIRETPEKDKATTRATILWFMVELPAVKDGRVPYGSMAFRRRNAKPVSTCLTWRVSYILARSRAPRIGGTRNSFHRLEYLSGALLQSE